MKKLILWSCTLTTFLLPSCAPQRITVYCEPHQAAIYIDGQYQGNGIINYSIPRKQKYIRHLYTLMYQTENRMPYIQR